MVFTDTQEPQAVEEEPQAAAASEPQSVEEEPQAAAASEPLVVITDTQEPVESRSGRRSPLSRHSFELLAEGYGLSAEMWRFMVLIRTLIWMFNLLWYLAQNSRLTNDYDLDLCELFAGVGAIFRAAQAAGLRAAQYDCLIHACQDIMRAASLIKLMQYLRRLRGGGLAHWATVCSSWIWVSRSCTKRSADCPLLQKPWSASVAKANCMVSRMVLGIFSILSKGCFLFCSNLFPL